MTLLLVVRPDGTRSFEYFKTWVAASNRMSEIQAAREGKCSIRTLEEVVTAMSDFMSGRLCYAPLDDPRKRAVAAVDAAERRARGTA